ncbi:MAG: hypothetical protein V1755_14845 [Chloroflexota bacterium]
MEMPVEKKESKTGAIIGTVAAIALCGLPGLCLLCPLSIAIFAGFVPDPTSSYGDLIPTAWGALPLCLSVVFIVIGVLIPVLTLRKKKEPAAEEILPPSEPLPPTA